MSDLATVKLTKAELWTLINNYEQGFDPNDPDNKLEAAVSKKLWAAYEKLTK